MAKTLLFDLQIFFDYWGLRDLYFGHLFWFRAWFCWELFLSVTLVFVEVQDLASAIPFLESTVLPEEERYWQFAVMFESRMDHCYWYFA